MPKDMTTFLHQIITVVFVKCKIYYFLISKVLCQPQCEEWEGTEIFNNISLFHCNFDFPSQSQSKELIGMRIDITKFDYYFFYPLSKVIFTSTV